MSEDFIDSQLNHPYTLKLVIVGDKMVGKTSIVNRYFHNTFNSKYMEEIWLKVTNKEVKMKLNEINVIVNYFVYDLASEETFEDYFKPFGEGANGILIIFDLTRENTFDSIDDWIRKLKVVTTEKVIKNSILCGNKSDLTELREVSQSDGILKQEKYGLIHYVETSAKNDEKINEAFKILVNKIIQDKK